METIISKIKEFFTDVDKRKVAFDVVVAFAITAFAYNSLNPQDLTTWKGVFDIVIGVLQNPYLLGLCAWNAYSAISDTSTITTDTIN